MSRIAGVPASTRNPVVRFIYRETRRQTGRMVQPVAAYAHRPRLLMGYGALELASGPARTVSHLLRELAVLKAATLVDCEFCIDIGSSHARRAGITEAQLLDLHRHRRSSHFDEEQRLVLDYSEAMTRTPSQVTDELFARMQERFDDRQIVELTHAVALENLRARFNAALDIGSAGFSEGMVCARPAGLEDATAAGAAAAARA